MKTILTSAYFKSLVLLITLGLVFTSCKEDHPLEIPDNSITDFHQTAQTKFINVDGNQIAYRVLGNQNGFYYPANRFDPARIGKQDDIDRHWSKGGTGII
ncbi:hypothetical protein L0663_17905 [Dyadobacter sp. CY107]|uniref:hypothetical protein n=1 Tax=Dyadobacter fanqingshengii TaxID=2906443 RepID=UPI001F1ADAC4|nr:hypothetical protein [Dyadobacter fanqingshengii]MCF2505272.1 hypothetical protein [Dyadobacter fanqingshengii]